MKNTELEKIKAAIYQKNLTYDELVSETAFWQGVANMLETAYDELTEIAESFAALHKQNKTLSLRMENAYEQGLSNVQTEARQQIKEALTLTAKLEKVKRVARAKNAANSRHTQPGGSLDKKQKIRDIWATGKYSSRDICAEEECASLGMSFSTARKALRNTPNPNKT